MFRTTEQSTAAIAFRTREQAEHFANGRGYAQEWEVQVLATSEAVIWLKHAHDNNGVKYVAFNPEPTTSHANASVMPIEVALAIFETPEPHVHNRDFHRTGNKPDWLLPCSLPQPMKSGVGRMRSML